MKENFPSLANEIDFQEVQEAQRVPKKLSPKRNTPRYIIIKLPKIKDKEKTLKAARGKERVTYKGVSIGYQLTSQKKPCRQEGAGKKHSKSWKARKDLYPRWLYPAKLSFIMEGQIKCFPDKQVKGVHHHQALIIWNVKGTYLRKRISKIGTVKMTANSQLQTTTPKTKTKEN